MPFEFASTLILVACLGCQAWPGRAIAGDEPSFDLRGPAPPRGFKFRESWKSECQRTDRLTSPNGRFVQVAGTILGDFESLHTVERTDGQDVSRYQTKIIKAEHKFNYIYPKGKRRTVDRIDDVAGEVVVSERLGGKWEHNLLDGEPTNEQRESLARLRSPFEERDHIPAGRLKKGASWDVDSVQMKRLLDPGVDAVSGKLRAEFAGLENLAGDRCAVIVCRGSLTVRSGPEDDIQERTEKIDMYIISHISLKHGIVVKSTSAMTSRSTGKMKLDDVVADLEGSGRTRVTYWATVEK